MTTRPVGRRAVVALSLLLLSAGLSQAQPLGTYRWQLQPYCNVITVTVVQVGDKYTLDGTDDLCGYDQRAAVSGLAYLNPSGTVGFGLTIVASWSSPVHIGAMISTVSLSGAWSDDFGHGGTFFFNPVAPSGPSRPTTAPTRMSVGHQNWVPYRSSDNLTFQFDSSYLTISKATTGLAFVSVSPSLPVVTDGMLLNLLGVEFCYQASSGAPMQIIELDTTTHLTGPQGSTRRAIDVTDRTDTACRFYPVGVPYTLTPNDTVCLFVSLNFQAPGAIFRIGRTTFIVERTGIPAPASSP